MKCWLPFSCLSHTLLNTVDFVMQIQNTTVFRPYTPVSRTSSPVHSNLDSTCDPRPPPLKTLSVMSLIYLFGKWRELRVWCRCHCCLGPLSNSNILVGGEVVCPPLTHSKKINFPGVYRAHCILFVSQFEYYIKKNILPRLEFSHRDCYDIRYMSLAPLKLG